MTLVKEITKALLAALIAALGTLGAYLSADVGLGEVTAGQWVQVAITGLVALGVVWGVPNTPRN